MNHHHILHNIDAFIQFCWALSFGLLWLLYLFAAMSARIRHKKWPFFRIVFWTLGMISAVLAITGPLAKQAHLDFKAHMIVHLLLGMLAPLFMVLAAPMTLLFRTLNVKTARKLSVVLRSKYVRIVSHPIAASFLNIGGLWVLYTTDLYAEMHANIFLHLFVHIHVFLAGYVFTASFLSIDPTPHRFGFIFRAIVFVLAAAGHSILSKYIYAHPPSGVSEEQAQLGGMLMYYGGDAVDIVMIIILCYQWYKASWPRSLSVLPKIH